MSQDTVEGVNTCMKCQLKWKDIQYVPCDCGAEANMKLMLRLLKDGRTGWLRCDGCEKLLNIDDARYKVQVIS